MKQLTALLTRILRIALGIVFSVLLAAVITQVVGRSIGSSPIWTEELTRYALLYLAAIGTGLSLQSGDLVNVDIVCDAFGEHWSRILRVISMTLTVLMCVYLLLPAWRFVEIAKLQTSPAIGLNMSLIHFSAFLLILLLLVFSLLRLIVLVMHRDDEHQKPSIK